LPLGISAKKRVVPQGDLVLDIFRFRKKKGDVSPFAPSEGLLNDWKQGRIVWKESMERYYRELRENKEVSSLITEIADHPHSGETFPFAVFFTYSINSSISSSTTSGTFSYSIPMPWIGSPGWLDHATLPWILPSLTGMSVKENSSQIGVPRGRGESVWIKHPPMLTLPVTAEKTVSTFRKLTWT